MGVPAQWVGDPGIAMGCGIGRRHGLYPALLWLWCSPAATAPIQTLAWKLPYAASMALKSTDTHVRERDNVYKIFSTNPNIVNASGVKLPAFLTI